MRIQVFLRPVIGDIFAKVLVFRPVVILYFYLFAEATAVQHDNQAGQQSGNDDGFHPVAIKKHGQRIRDTQRYNGHHQPFAA